LEGFTVLYLFLYVLVVSTLARSVCW